MRLLLSLPSSLALISLLLTAALLPSNAAAQTVQTSEYIYIGVEAEDHAHKDDRWVTTTPSTPTEENDPDGNHSDQAGGSTYLELLPDVRVTHDDEFGPPVAYWGQGGQGPSADYPLNFPEPGRYYVHVRAFSTGTEDNGIHIGLNGTWPQSGQRMQFCTASLNAWTWGSAQRDAGGNGSCGIQKSIWLDIPSAGMHTVSISAREDGFEIDKLALIKDLTGNTRVCSPSSLNGVNCVNGSIESADDFVDLRVLLSAVDEGADPDVEPPSPTEVIQGNNIELTAKIENLDAFDTAHEIVLTLTPVPGDWNMIDMDQRCVVSADEFICTLAELEPTAPNENAPFVFTMQARLDGDNRIDAAVHSDDLDDKPNNDVAATIIRVLPGTAPVDQDTDVRLRMDTNKNQYETGESMQLSVDLENLGNNDADNVSFSLTLPAGLSVNAQSLPNGCNTSASQVVCTFTSIAVSASESFDIDVTSEAAGVYTLNGNVGATNDSNSGNNLDAESVLVEDEEVDTTTDTDTSDTTDTTAGDTDGSTTDTNTDNGSDSTAGDTGNTDNSGDGTVEPISGVDPTAGQDNGDTQGSSTQGSTPVANNSADEKSGALVHWFVLAMFLLLLTRLYGRHQRELVTITK